MNTNDARRYREIVEQNYNKVVFQGDMKWSAWEKGKWSRCKRTSNGKSFTDADAGMFAPSGVVRM